MQYRTIPVLRMRWEDARDRLMRKGGHQNLTRQTRYDMGKKRGRRENPTKLHTYNIHTDHNSRVILYIEKT